MNKIHVYEKGVDDNIKFDNEQKKELYNLALNKYGVITGCHSYEASECFDEVDGYLLFWFNGLDKSTRLLKLKL